MWLCVLMLFIGVSAVVETVVARRTCSGNRCGRCWAMSRVGGGPDTRALRDQQERFRGTVGRAYRHLVASLESGASPGEAVAWHRKALPREAQAWAAVDVVCGVAPGTTSEAGPGESASATGTVEAVARQQIVQRVLYLGTVLLFLVLVLTFVLTRIVPAFEEIFIDFDMDLPAITEVLIGLGDIFTTGVPGVIVSAMMVWLLAFLAVSAVCYLCDYPVLEPLLDRVFFTRHRALVLRLLAISAERRKPFEDVLRQLVYGTPCYPSRVTRRRLGGALQSMVAGQDWKWALRQKSFLRRGDISALETAEQAGNLPWVLGMLARQKVRRMVYRFAVLENVVFPVVILMLGAVVMFVCVALFIPLVRLINGLV